MTIVFPVCFCGLLFPSLFFPVFFSVDASGSRRKFEEMFSKRNNINVNTQIKIRVVSTHVFFARFLAAVPIHFIDSFHLNYIVRTHNIYHCNSIINRSRKQKLMNL